jgi:putative flippase GtrA
MAAAARRGAALTGIKYGELVRYAATTIVGYGILYVGAYVLIERAHMSPGSAYMLLLTFLYTAVYVSYSLFVFRERSTAQTLRRFIMSLVVVWAVNNAFFYVLNQVFSVHYFAVITLNILLFGGIRFYVQRFYVFRSS